jgi:integral membrane protein
MIQNVSLQPNFQYFIKMKSIFRVVSFLEGVSYLLLMSLGLDYKYALKDPSFVKMFGMPHGILFILYIISAIMLKKQMKWKNITLAIVLLASILPFGTFYIDKKYLR